MIPSRIRRALAAVAVASTFAVGVMASAAGPVSAWVYENPVGSRGDVRVPTIYVGDLQIPDMPLGYTQFTLYGDAPVSAYRSPAATGVQTVRARYVVQRWDGTDWVNTARSDVMTRQIGSQQTRARFPSPYLQPQVSRGYLRLTYAFAWSDANGRALGNTVVTSNSYTDHVCVTNARWCRSYDGFVRTGKYMTNAW